MSMWVKIAIESFWKEEPVPAQCLKRFSDTFGCDPMDCESVWEGLLENGWIKKRTDIKPMHLLWAFFFLKFYLTTNVNAVIVGTSGKNFSEKVWFMLEGMSHLVEYYVSGSYF